MKTLVLTVALMLAVLGFESVTRGQVTGVEFGRMGPSSAGLADGGTVRIGPHGTSYTGKADSVEQGRTVTTWRGHLTVSFQDSQMVLQADEMILDENAHELALRGNVRLRLDTK
jgi:lipopolysaccharide assembly outer membrane protein LptD (OstA)